jgi:hypothetical protein
MYLVFFQINKITFYIKLHRRCRWFSMGYMVYDKQRDRIVLFGRRKGWPNDCNDTWEWDGLSWEKKFD